MKVYRNLLGIMYRCIYFRTAIQTKGDSYDYTTLLFDACVITYAPVLSYEEGFNVVLDIC